MMFCFKKCAPKPQIHVYSFGIPTLDCLLHMLMKPRVSPAGTGYFPALGGYKHLGVYPL